MRNAKTQECKKESQSMTDSKVVSYIVSYNANKSTAIKTGPYVRQQWQSLDSNLQYSCVCVRVCVHMLTLRGCSDWLGVRHGEGDRSDCTMMGRWCQHWGEVAWNLTHHLTAAVRLPHTHKTSIVGVYFQDLGCRRKKKSLSKQYKTPSIFLRKKTHKIRLCTLSEQQISTINSA